MKQVAKTIIIDANGNYLMLYRSDHPMFGVDPDIAGGTHEDGETLQQTLIREVKEELGLEIDKTHLKLLYEGPDYSAHGTIYALYCYSVVEQPELTLSWEHSSYEWIPKDDFVAKSLAANDTYMHMVGDVAKKLLQ